MPLGAWLNPPQIWHGWLRVNLWPLKTLADIATPHKRGMGYLKTVATRIIFGKIKKDSGNIITPQNSGWRRERQLVAFCIDSLTPRLGLPAGLIRQAPLNEGVQVGLQTKTLFPHVK
jgi:hypothetical protein